MLLVILLRLLVLEAWCSREQWVLLGCYSCRKFIVKQYDGQYLWHGNWDALKGSVTYPYSQDGAWPRLKELEIRYLIRDLTIVDI